MKEEEEEEKTKAVRASPALAGAEAVNRGRRQLVIPVASVMSAAGARFIASVCLG